NLLSALPVESAQQNRSGGHSNIEAQLRQKARALQRDVGSADAQSLARRAIEREDVIRSDGVFKRTGNVIRDIWAATNSNHKSFCSHALLFSLCRCKTNSITKSCQNCRSF